MHTYMHSFFLLLSISLLLFFSIYIYFVLLLIYFSVNCFVFCFYELVRVVRRGVLCSSEST